MDGDFLWRKPNDNLPINLRKIEGTNYFIAYNGSKGKVYNIYGKPVLIGGEEWFDEVRFDKENLVFECKIYHEKFERISEKHISNWAKKYISFEGIYTSMSEIRSIHDENVKLDRAALEAERAKSPGGSAFIMARYANAAKGTYMVTDAKFKVLKKQEGIFGAYLGKLYNNEANYDENHNNDSCVFPFGHGVGPE